MLVQAKIQSRFDQLLLQAEELIANQTTKTTHHPPIDPWFGGTSGTPARSSTSHWVDRDGAVQWFNSSISLLFKVFGPYDPTYQSFSSIHLEVQTDHFRGVVAVFRSAKDIFEGGFLFNVRNLVHAEVFSDELEQAAHFLELEYKVAAAVIAGTVLETTLRELCAQHSDLDPANADSMISNLAKQGVFNKMRADQLRAWMKTRNSAAHGKPDEFDDGDVARMIDGIRDFVQKHMD